MSYAEEGVSIDEGRMDTPAFHRNHSYVIEVLKSELATTPGHLLEVGSGSGQHAIVYAETFPALTIWPSDLNPAHVQSIQSWRSAANLSNIQPPFALDVAEEDWELETLSIKPMNLSGIISLNMVHISPIDVAKGLFRGAGKYLAATGKLFLYGPFMRDGQHTAPSNAEFDATLRARDPSWGIRDQVELEGFAEDNGLKLVRAVPMPANNFTLIFSRPFK